MYTITVKGEALTSYPHLERLDGICCQDEFSEYFGREEKALKAKGVHNGYMEFQYHGGKLWTVTTYKAKEELTEEELRKLEDYTTGQWSDGIGEGFEQEAACIINDEEVFISAWSATQDVTITQTHDN